MFGRRFFFGISVVAGAALVAAVAGTAQGASVPPWRIVHLVGPAGGETAMMGVAATSGSHAWAAGLGDCVNPQACYVSSLDVEQWNGRSWTTMSLPVSLGNGRDATYNPGIGASSPTNLWAFTTAGSNYADHWNGTKWTTSVVPGAATISATYVASTTDNALRSIPGTESVWAAGSIARYVNSEYESQGVILKYGS